MPKLFSTETFQQAIDTRLAEIPMRQISFSQKSVRPFGRVRRIVAVAAVVCIFVTCSGVLAASFPALQELFGIVGEDTSKLLQPIELSCTDNNITMEVLATIDDNETSLIYISLQGVPEDATLLNPMLSNSEIPLSCTLLHYDKPTQTGFYCLSGYTTNAISTLSLQTLLIDADNEIQTNTGLSAQTLIQEFTTPQIQENVFVTAFSRQYAENSDYVEPATPTLLSPGEVLSQWDNVFPWADVTAVGIIDNMLHIQMKANALGCYTDASLYWLNAEDLPVETDLMIYEFGETFTQGNYSYSEYKEYVLPFPEQPLSELTLGYDANGYRQVRNGNWQVTFAPDTANQIIETACDFYFGSYHINTISVSSLGVTLSGQEQDSDTLEACIEVYDINGSLIPLSGSIIESDGTYISLKEIFETPISLTQIDCVVVDGVQVMLLAQ